MSDVTFFASEAPRKPVASAGSPTPAIPACDRVQYDALFDPGTKLPGLALLLDRIGVAIVRAHREHRRVALFVLSDIRTARSTARVDIQAIALLLQCRLHQDDTVARVGDSVVVVCNAVDADVDAALIVRRIMEITGTVCCVDVTLSGNGANAELLLADALGHLS